MSTPLEAWLEKVNNKAPHVNYDETLELGVAIAVIEKLKEALENVDSLEIGVANTVNSISRKALAIDPERL